MQMNETFKFSLNWLKCKMCILIFCFFFFNSPLYKKDFQLRLLIDSLSENVPFLRLRALLILILHILLNPLKTIQPYTCILITNIFIEDLFNTRILHRYGLSHFRSKSLIRNIFLIQKSVTVIFRRQTNKYTLYTSLFVYRVYSSLNIKRCFIYYE